MAQALPDYTFVKKWADQSDKLAGLLLPKNGYEYSITPNVSEPTTTIRVTKTSIADPAGPPMLIGQTTISNFDLALSQPDQIANLVAEVVMQIVNSWKKHMDTMATMASPIIPEQAYQALQQQSSLAQQLSGVYGSLGAAVAPQLGGGGGLAGSSGIAGFDNGIQSKFSSPLSVNTSKLIADQLDKDKKEMDKAIAENAPNAKYLVEQYWMKLKSFQATQEKEILAEEEKTKQAQLAYIKKYGGIVQNTGTITDTDGTVLTVAGITQAVQSLQGKSVMSFEPNKAVLVPPNFEGIEEAVWVDGLSPVQLKAQKPEAAKYVKDRGDFGSQTGQRFIMKLGAMSNMHVTFRGKMSYSPTRRTTYTFFCDQCPDSKLDITAPGAVAQIEEFDSTNEDMVRFCTDHQHLVAAAPSGEGRKFREAD